jgi:hypothetical protein
MTTADAAGQTDRSASALFFLVSATCLGHAIQLGNGTIYNSADTGILFNSSIGWLTAAFIVACLAVLLPRIAALELFSQKNFALFAFLAITWQFYSQLTTSPGAYIDVNVFRALQTFILFMTIAFACAVSSFSQPPLGRLAVPLLLLCFTCAGVWLLRVDSNPSIDVHIFHHDSTIALLHGQNPYTLTFPDIYTGKYAIHAYNSRTAAHGRALFGFPYLPLTLVLSTLAQALYHDYRLAHLLALTLAGAFMMLSRRGRYAILAVAVFLLSPRIFFVLEEGYIEPYLIFFFAAVIYAACRAPRHINWIFGLFLASKQYIVISLPLALLLHSAPKSRLRFVLVSLITAAAITLPFILWNPPAFIRSAVTLQFQQPFRDDALSYQAWLSHTFHTTFFPSLTGFAAAAIFGWLAYLHAPRTPAGIAGAIALEFFAFFAFNKQAFANYYLFVIGAMCCAIAANAATEAAAPVIKLSDSPSRTSATAPRSGSTNSP